MKRLLVLVVVVPVVALALTAPPKAHKWQDAEPSLGPIPSLPTDRDAEVVMIDTFTTYIRYLFQHQQALVLLVDNMNYFFFWAYNDGYSHVRTKVFSEDQIDDPGSWIAQDIFEWTGDGSLRYISPSAYSDGVLWYPQVTFNTAPPSTCWYMIDEGGYGIWSNPYDLLIPCDHPVTWTGPDNVVYLLGTNAIPAGYLFVAFDGWSGSVLNQVPVLPTAHGLGYENSQLVYHEGTNKIVVAAGGYRTGDFGAPDNPLLVVYQESTDGGETWSDEVWLDRETVPDMPGSVPGIEGHYSNSFFDLLMDDDGDLHVAAVIADSGHSGNQSKILGLYDIHQDEGEWHANVVCDGIYLYEGEVWDPGDLYTDPIGDSWMHSPSLSLHPDGSIFAAWNDIGEHNDADTTASLGVWTCASLEGGNTWFAPFLMTDTAVEDEYFSRLTYNTTEENVHCVTMYGAGGVDGPLYCLQVPVTDYVNFGVDDSPKPEIAKLSDPKPNPFRDEVSLSLTLTKPARINANVYNIREELVQALESGRMRAGTHELVFDPRNHAPGVYFCRVQTENETMFKKLVFIK